VITGEMIMKNIFSKSVLLAMFVSCHVFANPVGVYEITAESPMGEMNYVMTINADGTGFIDGMLGKTEFRNANIDGNEFDFEITVNSPMGEMEMLYEGEVDGDIITGVTINPMGGSEYSGVRKK
jgi:hypothetical protein